MKEDHQDTEAMFQAAVERLHANSEALTIEITRRFTHVLEHGIPVIISGDVRERVTRRAANVDKYATAEGIPVLLSMDIMSLCDRLLAYPFIARYRRTVAEPYYFGRTALLTHIHALTGGELYIVMERSTVLLRDIWLFADNFGIAGEQCWSSFQKKFRKRFDPLLRDRHRTAHAHETPSAQSRVINLSNRAWGLPEEFVRQHLNKLIGAMAEIMSENDLRAEEIREASSNAGQEAKFIQNAVDAFEILADSLRRSVTVAR